MRFFWIEKSRVFFARFSDFILKFQGFSCFPNFLTILVDAKRECILSKVGVHKNNTESLWKITKENIPLKERDSVVYSKDSKLVAEEFNYFFSTAGGNAAMEALSLKQNHNIHQVRNSSNAIVLADRGYDDRDMLESLV